MTAASSKLRVLFVCTGVGILNRGIESFFREAYDNLRGLDGISAVLVKGAGEPRCDEIVVRCLPRTIPLANLLGSLVSRNGYVVEQWSSFIPIASAIRKIQPDVVFYSDQNLGFLLYRFRRQIGVPYRLLFSNGGPCEAPFVRTDFVHQVTPYNYQNAMNAGEPADKHFMVPYGIKVSSEMPALAGEDKKTIRRSLGIPVDRQVVLSVGWISSEHKRMNYLVNEIASLPAPRPFLMMLGNMTKESAKIIELARAELGDEGFAARSVPYVETGDYYKTADCFVLASLQEGFGRVFLEALSHGLRIIAHDHPVMRYVLGEHGVTGNLQTKDKLAMLIKDVLGDPDTIEAKRARWAGVKSRFSWPVLAPEYKKMFETVKGRELLPWAE